MSLIRWSPAQELARSRDDFDRIVTGFFPGESLETSYGEKKQEKEEKGKS